MGFGKKTFFLTLIFLLIGIAIGYALCKIYNTKPIPILRGVRQSGFRYTSPLLYYEIDRDNSDFVRNINSKIAEFIKKETDGNKKMHVSVYLRYPHLTQWTTVNEKMKYSPASLLKVPVMMVYYNKSQTDPNILSKKLAYNIENDNEKTNYKPNEEMKKDEEYTIDDLIRRMIIYSDNTAENMLTMNIQKEDFDQIFDDIKIDKFNYENQEDSMDVVNYSYFFRVLYNSTFLNKNASEKALKLLTETKFQNGILKGAPKDIEVAHKFGERYFSDTGIRQLHDCGIVYYPQNPYILCVMTRGNSFENLEKMIQKISRMVFEYTKSETNNTKLIINQFK